MMKRLASFVLTAAIVMTGFLGMSSESFATEDTEISYDQVAGIGEMATPQELAVEGMKPVYGTDVVDGVYNVEVECTSTMFIIEKAELTVQDGEMTAILTMGADGYLKVFMGTGQEAAASEISDYIDFELDADGKQNFTIPVEALDHPIDCAGFSKNREKWYDRQLLFRAESLPKEAVLVELPDYEALEQAAKEKRIAAIKAENETKEAAAEAEKAAAGQAEEMTEQTTTAPDEPISIEREDGHYTIPVELTGGTGRSTITSPTVLVVRYGKAYAQIEWSSDNYDYMKVGEEKYLPINSEGNSVFEIPITVMDEPMTVIADTTAMSVPHEIEYTLTFQSKGIESESGMSVLVPAVIGAAVVVIILVVMKKRGKSAK